jgi:hypothetical protein
MLIYFQIFQSVSLPMHNLNSDPRRPSGSMVKKLVSPAESLGGKIQVSSNMGHSWSDDDEEEECVVPPPQRRIIEEVVAKYDAPSSPPLMKKLDRALPVPPEVKSSWNLSLLVVFCCITAIGISIYASNVRQWSKKPTETSIPIYPLWREPHTTTSRLFNTHALYAKPLANGIEPSFIHHLTSGSQYTCLCMHHLKISNLDENYQLCAIYNPLGQLYLMANPRIIGKSNTTTHNGSFDSIMLEWDTVNVPHRSEYAQFSHNVAECMQVAIGYFN